MLTTRAVAMRWLVRPPVPAGLFAATGLAGLALAQPRLLWAGVAGVAGYALSGSV